MTRRTIHPAPAPFHARIRVPGDKSWSHRALLFAAMAEGESAVTGLGPGRDIRATAAALARFGVDVRPDRIVSPGVAGWSPPGGEIDCGNSGTTMRLLAGILSGRPFRSVLTGDQSLRARPMRRLIDPLAALGATVEVGEHGTAPIVVGGARSLRGARVSVPMASAQVRSAAELAALQAEGDSVVDGPAGFRDHTERWLEAMDLGSWESATAFRVEPGPVPPADYPVPADPSSAAFLWAAAALRSGASVTTPGVCLNPGRTGFLDVLADLGAEVEVETVGTVHGDPVGDVTVTGAPLSGTTVQGIQTVRALDELPLVAVVAAFGTGETVVADAAELRVKESDRIATTVAMIRRLGGSAEATPGGFVIVGTDGLRGGTVEAAGDHRIAMSAAVAATGAESPVDVVDADVAAVSWPGFYEVLEGVCSSR